MAFRRHHETDLERELRAQRPQPRDEFVQMLSGKHGARQNAHRSAMPGRAAPPIALVAAVTVVLAASLGVAGALGHATSSIKSLGTSVYDVVHAPAPVVQNTSNHQSGGNNNNGNNTNDGKGDSGSHGSNYPGDPDHDDHHPFNHQYHHPIAICHDGHIVFVPEEAFWPFIFAGHGHWWAPFFTPLRCFKPHGH